MTEGIDNLDKNYWFYMLALVIMKYGGEISLSQDFIDRLTGKNFELETNVDWEENMITFKVVSLD